MTSPASAACYVVVTTTTAAAEEAEAISNRLLEARLAACVQIMPIESRYVWQGRIERSREVLLLIKARAADYAAIEAQIRAVHGYSVPEIVAVPVTAGSPGYLAWIDEVTARG